MMKQRKCQGCQKIDDGELLIKVTRDHLSGELFVNPDSKVTGRSLYVCKNEKCLKTLLKKKRIEKNFKGKALTALNLSELEANLEGTPHP